MSVAKQMKAYEDHLYEEWRTQVEIALPGLLKRNLLVKPTDKQAAVAAPAAPAADDLHIHETEAGMTSYFMCSNYVAENKYHCIVVEKSLLCIGTKFNCKCRQT